jgi:hypothetical protein
MLRDLGQKIQLVKNLEVPWYARHQRLNRRRAALRQNRVACVREREALPL